MTNNHFQAVPFHELQLLSVAFGGMFLQTKKGWCANCLIYLHFCSCRHAWTSLEKRWIQETNPCWFSWKQFPRHVSTFCVPVNSRGHSQTAEHQRVVSKLGQTRQVVSLTTALPQRAQQVTLTPGTDLSILPFLLSYTPLCSALLYHAKELGVVWLDTTRTWRNAPLCFCVLPGQ